MKHLIMFSFLLLVGCNSPTIKDWQGSCVISLRLGTFNCGPRILDYKQSRETVGEWANLKYNIYGSIDQIQDGSLLEIHKTMMNELALKVQQGDTSEETKELLYIETFRVSILEKSLELISFTTESWLLKIKPTMKEGHDFWIDYRKR